MLERLAQLVVREVSSTAQLWRSLWPRSRRAPPDQDPVIGLPAVRAAGGRLVPSQPPIGLIAEREALTARRRERDSAALALQQHLRPTGTPTDAAARTASQLPAPPRSAGCWQRRVISRVVRLTALGRAVYTDDRAWPSLRLPGGPATSALPGGAATGSPVS